MSGQGRYVGPLGLLLRAQILRPFVRHQIRVPLAAPNAAAFEELAEAVTSGWLTPVVDRTFGLADAAHALAYLETARARGKVVVSITG